MDASPEKVLEKHIRLRQLLEIYKTICKWKFCYWSARYPLYKYSLSVFTANKSENCCGYIDLCCVTVQTIVGKYNCFPLPTLRSTDKITVFCNLFHCYVIIWWWIAFFAFEIVKWQCWKSLTFSPDLPHTAFPLQDVACTVGIPVCFFVSYRAEPTNGKRKLSALVVVMVEWDETMRNISASKSLISLCLWIISPPPPPPHTGRPWHGQR